MVNRKSLCLKIIINIANEAEYNGMCIDFLLQRQMEADN